MLAANELAMTLLSRKADYALLILSHLHERKEGANARTIAERFELSRPFVANILKELAGKGYLSSQRGVKGGYTILRNIREITIADLLEALGESFHLTVCNTHRGVSGSETCNLESTCPVRTPMAEIHRRIINVLREVSLAELFQNNEPVGRAAATLLPLLTIRETPTTA
jgi:Rrf2 family transcriptional regulator, cysteine metabolism repressor